MILNRKDVAVGFISLGCDKNRVDLEKMIALIKNAGYKIETDERKANIIIINTCSFILSAREESIENILLTAELKKGCLNKIIVTGCLNHMNYSDLEESLPEVDAFVKVSDNANIVSIIDNLIGVCDESKCLCDGCLRILSTPPHYAYLKISEGCDNFCTYCKIPYIRGRYYSYSLDSILNEANYLVNNGVKEIILVAQDVTKYGLDFKDGTNLVTLIQRLSDIPGLEKIRLLYCYPELITDELIHEIKINPKVCKYIDIPLQHISNNILKKMNRRSNKESIELIINKLKQNIPNIAIRTTFIIGFPGETEKEFEEVLSFITNHKLNNVGFFAYSKEEGTPAYSFNDQVEESVANERINKLAIAQFNNVIEHNQSMINKVLDVVVDNVIGSKVICRSEFECPEIDGVIILKNTGKINIGENLKVIIKNYNKYDLEGEIYEKLTK